MSNPYSNLKMPWWYLRDGGISTTPKQAHVILSDLCNQDCSFCAYRMSGYTSNELFMGKSEASPYGHSNPKRWIPTDRALALLDELKSAGVLAVQFTGGGEPTVHPDHDRIFRRALDLGFKCSLVSNGVKWADSLYPILMDFDWVRVSIDAGTPETYARIRNTPKGNFEKVWDHVRTLAAIKPGPILGIGYVVIPGNDAEIVEACRIASESGANNVRLSAAFTTEGEKPYADIYDDIKERIILAKRLYERPDFAIHDLFGDRVADLKQHNPDYRTCHFQSYTTYIGGDLNVYRCCVYAYNERGKIAGGNLKERSFDAFWKSDERKADFKSFDARGCERCQFNEKNRIMDTLLSDDITHKEFP